MWVKHFNVPGHYLIKTLKSQVAHFSFQLAYFWHSIFPAQCARCTTKTSYGICNIKQNQTQQAPELILAEPKVTQGKRGISLWTHINYLYTTQYIFIPLSITSGCECMCCFKQNKDLSEETDLTLNCILSVKRGERGAWWDNERSSCSWDGRAENEQGNNWQLELFALLHLMHRVKKGPGRDGSRSQTRIPALIATYRRRSRF